LAARHDLRGRARDPARRLPGDLLAERGGGREFRFLLVLRPAAIDPLESRLQPVSISLMSGLQPPNPSITRHQATLQRTSDQDFPTARKDMTRVAHHQLASTERSTRPCAVRDAPTGKSRRCPIHAAGLPVRVRVESASANSAPVSDSATEFLVAR